MNTDATSIKDDLRAPIGLDAAKKVIHCICREETMYQRSSSRPGHYIIDLDAGNGQTTLTEYFARCFSKYRIRQFSGIDHYLEYRLDGTTDDLKRVFRDIRNQAVYTNEYEGIVAIDVCALAQHQDEAQVSYFLKQVQKQCSFATFIFYVPAVATRSTVGLVEKVKKTIDDVVVIHIDPYTAGEIAKIVASIVSDSGVELDEENLDDAEHFLEQIVTEKGIKTIREAKRMASFLIKHADYEQFTPCVPNAVLKAMIADNTDKRAERK